MNTEKQPEEQVPRLLESAHAATPICSYEEYTETDYKLFGFITLWTVAKYIANENN